MVMGKVVRTAAYVHVIKVVEQIVNLIAIVELMDGIVVMETQYVVARVKSENIEFILVLVRVLVVVQ